MREELPSGELCETFMSRLKPTIQQLENLKVHASHQFSVLYSLSANNRLSNCDSINISDAQLANLINKEK